MNIPTIKNKGPQFLKILILLIAMDILLTLIFGQYLLHHLAQLPFQLPDLLKPLLDK